MSTYCKSGLVLFAREGRSDADGSVVGSSVTRWRRTPEFNWFACATPGASFCGRDHGVQSNFHLTFYIIITCIIWQKNGPFFLHVVYSYDVVFLKLRGMVDHFHSRQGQLKKTDCRGEWVLVSETPAQSLILASSKNKYRCYTFSNFVAAFA